MLSRPLPHPPRSAAVGLHTARRRAAAGRAQQQCRRISGGLWDVQKGHMPPISGCAGPASGPPAPIGLTTAPPPAVVDDSDFGEPPPSPYPNTLDGKVQEYFDKMEALTGRHDFDRDFRTGLRYREMDRKGRFISMVDYSVAEYDIGCPPPNRTNQMQRLLRLYPGIPGWAFLSDETREFMTGNGYKTQSAGQSGENMYYDDYPFDPTKKSFMGYPRALPGYSDVSKKMWRDFQDHPWLDQVGPEYSSRLSGASGHMIVDPGEIGRHHTWNLGGSWGQPSKAIDGNPMEPQEPLPGYGKTKKLMLTGKKEIDALMLSARTTDGMMLTLMPYKTGTATALVKYKPVSLKTDTCDAALMRRTIREPWREERQRPEWAIVPADPLPLVRRLMGEEVDIMKAWPIKNKKFQLYRLSKPVSYVCTVHHCMNTSIFVAVDWELRRCFSKQWYDQIGTQNGPISDRWGVQHNWTMKHPYYEPDLVNSTHNALMSKAENRHMAGPHPELALKLKKEMIEDYQKDYMFSEDKMVVDKTTGKIKFVATDPENINYKGTIHDKLTYEAEWEEHDSWF